MLTRKKNCHQHSGPVPSSGSSEGSGSSLCVWAWCLHVCLWVGCHPSACGELIGVAAARADANLMCQFGGDAWAAITFTEKQVTLTEVMLLQWVAGLNKWHRHWATGSFTQRLSNRRQWSDVPRATNSALTEGSITVSSKTVTTSQQIASIFVVSSQPFTSSVYIQC